MEPRTPAKKATSRSWMYLISGLLAAVVPILVQTGILDPGQGNNSATMITSLVALLGGGGAITAGVVTRNQVKNGLHDETLSPIDQIQSAIPQVLDQAATAQANVDAMRKVAGDFLSASAQQIPIVGAPVSQAINMGNSVMDMGSNLAQQALDSILPH